MVNGLFVLHMPRIELFPLDLFEGNSHACWSMLSQVNFAIATGAEDSPVGHFKVCKFTLAEKRADRAFGQVKPVLGGEGFFDESNDVNSLVPGYR